MNDSKLNILNTYLFKDFELGEDDLDSLEIALASL